MAETDQYEIWSWKEAYPGTNIADYIGQKAADEMGDIQIKVKNKADFLNIENQGHEEYKKQMVAGTGPALTFNNYRTARS